MACERLHWTAPRQHGIGFAIVFEAREEFFLVALARWAGPRVSGFIGQHLANTAWACTMAVHSDELLFVTLATWAEWHVSDFIGPHLANTA